MLSLIRFLERPGLWTELEDTAAPVSVSSPLELLIDICLVKGQGASYFQVDFNGAESLNRAVAAYIANQSAIKPVHVGIVPLTEFEKLGVSVVQRASPGADTTFSENSHYDVNVSGIQQAIDLAEVVRNRIESVPKQDVQRHLFWAINQGYIAIGKLPKELLVKLAKDDWFVLRSTPNDMSSPI